MEEFLNQLLIEAISSYELLGNKVAMAAIAKRLPTMRAYGSIQVHAADLFQTCLAILQEKGTVLRMDAPNQILLAMVGSGVANLNPAVLILKIEGNTVHLASAAKEGLIKQRTAEKAIASFLSCLQESAT